MLFSVIKRPFYWFVTIYIISKWDRLTDGSQNTRTQWHTILPKFRAASAVCFWFVILNGGCGTGPSSAAVAIKALPISETIDKSAMIQGVFH